MSKFDATTYKILRLKCTKFHFRRAPPLTALPQIPQRDLRGPTSKGREGRKDGREGQGRRRREGRVPTSKAR